MTTGALIFAYDNEQIDYVAMAAWSAANIRRHLGIPVCIVTDRPVDETLFDRVVYVNKQDPGQRYFEDFGSVVSWYNTNRMDAYHLSPWNQTLLLDADYVVASNQLQSVLGCDREFVCHKTAYDVTGLDDFQRLNYFGKYQMPMWWATVIMFRRSEKAEMIFDLMSKIKENWTHYRLIYDHAKPTYRNDHSLSIALNVENGHTLQVDEIPWSLASVSPDHRLTQVDQDQYRVEFLTPDKKPRYITLSGDFHAMGKKHLGEIVANHC